MRLLPLLSVAAALALCACSDADREALGLAKTPPAARPAPATASAALVFPPAPLARVARLYPKASPHRALRRVDRHAYAEARLETIAYAPPLADGGYVASRAVSAASQSEWREHGFEHAESYDRDEAYAPPPAEAAGRDRHGFLTWPGKVPARP